MPQPPPYVAQTNFAQDETGNVAGRSTVRTAMLDAELAAIALTISQARTNLALIQRDDGLLKDGLVRGFNLAPDVLLLLGSAGWLPRGLWLPGASYAQRDLVEFGGGAYVAPLAHVAGDFATDYLAGKWQALSKPGTATRNLIIGGDFDTNPWQRGTVLGAVAHATYLADCWRYDKTGSMVHTMNRNGPGPSLAQCGRISNNTLRLLLTTAQASLTGSDYCALEQILEGYLALNCVGQPLVLSFWVQATLPGIYTACLRSGGAPFQSCAMQYTINSANTWERKVLVLPPMPANAPSDFSNGSALTLFFTLGSGSTLRASTANQWVSGNLVAGPNQVNGVASGATSFQVALVDLRPGSEPYAWDARTFDEERTLCQRRFWKSFPLATAPAQNTGSIIGALIYRAMQGGSSSYDFAFPLAVTMRTPPSLTFYNPGNSNSNWRNVSIGQDSGASSAVSASENMLQPNNTQAPSDVAGHRLAVHLTASADF
jgi:hypothetical protein